MGRLRCLLLLCVIGCDAISEVPESVGPPASVTEVEWGARLFQSWGCIACHSIDGRKTVAASLAKRWGVEQELTTGEKVIFDEAYFRRSITAPNSQTVKNNQGFMPKYDLSEDELNALGAFIQSLK